MKSLLCNISVAQSWRLPPIQGVEVAAQRGSSSSARDAIERVVEPGNVDAALELLGDSNPADFVFELASIELWITVPLLLVNVLLLKNLLIGSQDDRRPDWLESLGAWCLASMLVVPALGSFVRASCSLQADGAGRLPSLGAEAAAFSLLVVLLAAWPAFALASRTTGRVRVTRRHGQRTGSRPLRLLSALESLSKRLKNPARPPTILELELTYLRRRVEHPGEFGLEPLDPAERERALRAGAVWITFKLLGRAVWTVIAKAADIVGLTST